MDDQPKYLSFREALFCPFCGEQPHIQPWHGGGPARRSVGEARELLGMTPAETIAKPEIGFGVPTLADRVKEVMAETHCGFESALQTVSEECELRSEAIFAVRQYFDHYEPSVNRGVKP